MANYELDPLDFIPPGFEITNGGPLRLPRTFFSPANGPERTHEQYAIGIVEPEPLPEENQIFCNMVSDFLVNQLNRDVVSAQPWIQGVGLFEFRSMAARQVLIDHPPFDLGNERFVRFIAHDTGINHRASQGFRRGWVMLLGVPLDYRRTNYFADAVSTFGRFLS